MNYSNCSLVTIVVLCSVLIWLVAGDDKTPSSNSAIAIAPHCSDKCGDVTIPYPFGIEEGCYYNDYPKNPIYSSFHINCNHSTNPPTPSFGSTYYISNISLEEGELHTDSYVSADYYNQSGRVKGNTASFRLSTFTLSRSKNILVAIGCDTISTFSGIRGGKQYETGCITKCVDPEDVIDGECNGVGCCQASIPDGITNTTINVYSDQNHSSVYNFNPCHAAFAIAKDSFKFYRANLSHDYEFYDHYKVPIVLSWTITGQGNCLAAKANGSLLCGENAKCYEPYHEAGYRCICNPGFFGNPYLPLGCQDVDECKQAKDNCEKAEYCKNTIGSYDCKCPKGYHGNGTSTDRCVSNMKPWFIPVLATAGVGGGIIALLVIGFVMHWKHGKMQLKKMRDSFFLQNGGMLLHEKLSQRRVDHSLKIFTAHDLEVASNDYTDENVIGRGGFGVVYKGVLPDSQVVAIKKSLRVDPNQVEEFINEIIILSQIKNKYVVKLLGCCLESEVPLLVYEFVNNGTLYDHLNDGVKASILKWPVRLKIASQVANVLSYLHNTIATPIIHRDMKSMNILLDESYTAKVIDFGASRLIPPDQHQFATMVLGTRGYLDPEYLQTSELTEKSDVYSFGVVLVELLTRKKAISLERPEIEKCLAMHFLLKMKEGRLFDILDRSIVTETTVEEIQQVANLAKWCLKLKGDERPTMKEVAMELETIKGKGSHPWNDDDGSIQEDCESLLAGLQRSDHYGGCSSGIESNAYDSQLLSSLEIGR